MVRVIEELRPTWVVGENVAGIVKMALPDILSELEACGYATRAFLIPACAVGARHRRYRVAIVGHAKHDGLSAAEKPRSTGEAGKRSKEGQETASEFKRAGEPRNGEDVGRTEVMENTGCGRCSKQEDVCEQPRRAEFERPGKIMADTGCIVQQRNWANREQTSDARYETRESKGSGCNVSDPNDGSRSVRWDGEFSTVEEAGSGWSDFGKRTQEHEPGQRRTAQSLLGGMADGISDWMDGDLDFFINHYWDKEPDIPRIASGVPNRVDRLKCLGNAVVPQQFYPIFKVIADIEKKGELE